MELNPKSKTLNPSPAGGAGQTNPKFKIQMFATKEILFWSFYPAFAEDHGHARGVFHYLI
jgi:hypothetical protein